MIHCEDHSFIVFYWGHWSGLQEMYKNIDLATENTKFLCHTKLPVDGDMIYLISLGGHTTVCLPDDYNQNQ